ncbi:Rid family hydrolase [Streptomyces sp. NPDC059875]|uniref:Rid family hydrolase n=1 Tax=unclassified Streptomyces TaxID=2593676 RepID=UPI00365E1DBF
MTTSDDVVEQAEQCLRNISYALKEADYTFADVVRVRYLLPNRDDFEPCRPCSAAASAAFGRPPP